ncbi:MAG TPA: hypothetical protein VKE42_01085, partial [Candidatus Cybelea sp.]|nr:hypothetical protein [Candidatus Cybelea sp.]
CVVLARRALATHEIAEGRLVRLFDIDGPSPWQYFFVCPPQTRHTPRVEAFHDWIFGEAARFKAELEQVCSNGRNGQMPGQRRSRKPARTKGQTQDPLQVRD